MGDDEKRKAFLKGFEEGLKSAWREIAGLMTRGYSSTELMVFAKSKMAVLYREVEAMEARLIDEEGIPVVGGGEMTAREDLRRRGAYLVREPKAERVFEFSGIFSGARRAAFASPGSIRTTRGRATASRPPVSSGSRSPPVRTERTWRLPSPRPSSTSRPRSPSSPPTAGTLRFCSRGSSI